MLPAMGAKSEAMEAGARGGGDGGRRRAEEGGGGRRRAVKGLWGGGQAGRGDRCGVGAGPGCPCSGLIGRRAGGGSVRFRAPRRECSCKPREWG
jgi:hypothetical protein